MLLKNLNVSEYRMYTNLDRWNVLLKYEFRYVITIQRVWGKAVLNVISA